MRTNIPCGEARLFLTAWVFLTRVPLPIWLGDWVGYSADMLRGSARYFPLVGILVGVFAAGVFAGASWLFPPMIAVALSMIATVVLTGAFHEDGLADCCDGFGGGYTAERVLEIMHDSRVGAFGAIGVTLMLLLKFATLVSFAETGEIELAGWVMVIAHGVSRAAAVSVMRFTKYVRVDTGPKAKPLADGISLGAWVVALILAAVPFIFAARGIDNGWLLALGLLPVALATWAAGAYFVRRIGGYTGDCLGATQQVAEVVFYLFAAGLVNRVTA